MFVRYDQSTALAGRGRFRIFLSGLFLLVLLLPLAAVHAKDGKTASPQRAIEQLEGCSRQDRKGACVRILLRRKSGPDTLAIKAEVRGSRIIWYSYDKRTGAVRRTN